MARRQDGGPGRVTSCAGVAIIKPHFPFHAAYELAEDLIVSAKKKYKPLSAFDFHILYDVSGPDLARIRGELTTDHGQTHLVARPYLVSEQGEHGPRHVRTLEQRLRALQARDEDGRRRLPNSMLHDLRLGLFLGHEAAEARLGLVRERYRAHGIAHLLQRDRLFWEEEGKRLTALLDAMDLVEFWEDGNHVGSDTAPRPR
jgi:hypothetical protein